MDKDNILFHQYIAYIHLTEEEGDYYFSLLNLSKVFEENNYHILQLILDKKDNNLIRFNGIIDNDNEYRFIDGAISGSCLKRIIDMRVADLNYNHYDCVDVFCFKEDNVLRKSVIDGKTYSEDIVILPSSEETKQYKLSLVERYNN